MARPFDVIVVGLGVMGAATLAALARRGARVLGIDRYRPPHDHGSSHGETRATRLAVGEGDVFVPLVRRSHALWRELEARTGVRLLDQCGFLTIDTSGGAGSLHGMAGFLDRTVDVAQRHAIAHELLDAKEIATRFPAFAPPDHTRGYFEPEGGLIHAEPAIMALVADAAAHGAEVLLDERMISHDSTAHGVELTTGSASYGAEAVVLATGAWLALQCATPLAALQILPQHLHWFDPADAAPFARERCPVFLWLHGAGSEDCFYGFPQVAPGSGVKMATEQYRVRERTVLRAAEPDCQWREAFAARHIAGRFATPLVGKRSAACRYTFAPDANFVIDRLPSDPRLIAVSACSGHGFKHAPAIGELVATMVCENIAAPAAFALDRPALKQAIANPEDIA